MRLEGQLMDTRIGKSQAGEPPRRLEGWRQGIHCRSQHRRISLGTGTLQIDRIRQRGLINQGRLNLNSVFAERRGNTGRDNARYETNTRGDPAHSNQGIFRSLGTFSYGTQN